MRVLRHKDGHERSERRSPKAEQILRAHQAQEETTANYHFRRPPPLNRSDHLCKATSSFSHDLLLQTNPVTRHCFSCWLFLRPAHAMFILAFFLHIEHTAKILHSRPSRPGEGLVHAEAQRQRSGPGFSKRQLVTTCAAVDKRLSPSSR